MDLLSVFYLLYGVLTIAGGVIGFVTAGSKVSLIMGGVSGLLIIASTIGLMKGKPLGYYGLLGVALILGVFFAIRFFKSFAVMPAGLMLALSLLTLAGLLFKKPAFLQSA